MANLNTQIKVGADSSGVATGLEPGKRALKDFGASADGAGKSLAGMGNGSAQSAQKVEQATKSMIQSIQRTTAATEAGDKSTRAYQESLARMRGIDVAALKPYLDQLDAAKSKASLAATANESFSASFVGIRNAALIASAAVGSFAIAFKKINDGVDALNDLKDATGASIENISALENVARRTGGSFDVVSTSLVKLNQGLSGAKPGSDTELAIKAIGLSVADLKKLDPAEAFRKTAIALSGFSDDANKARLTQELFGKSLKEVAPFLKDLAESGELVATVTTKQAEEAEALNKQLSALGKTAQDAARSLVANMVPAINEVIAAMKKGGISAGLDELGNQLFDWEGNANRKGIKNLESDLKSLREQQSLITIDIFGKKGAIQQEIDTKIAMLAAAKASYFKLTEGVGGGRGSVNPALVDARQSVGDFADTKAVKDSTKAIKENTDARRFQEERMRLSRALAIADGKSVEDANDAYKKMMDDLAKANDKYIEGLNKSADSIAENVLKLNDEEAALRISAEQKISLAQAIEGITIKRLEEKRVMELIGNNDASAQAIAREIEQRKLLANAIDSKDAREATIKSAADAAAEWKKTSDSINSTLTDALMRGFESGKDFARNLRDTVVNMFKTLVLRPVISAVMNPIAGAVSGALGLSGAAQAAGAATSGASAIGAAGTLASLATTAASWGTAAGAGFMATIGGSTIAGGGAAGILATGGAAGAGVAGMIGALGPYALAALAVLAIHDMTQGETRNGAKYGVGSDGKAVKLEGPSGGEIAATQAQAMFNVAKSSIEGMLTGFGSKAVLTGFTAGLESSENGKGFAYATGAINGKSFGDVNTYMNSRGDKTQEQALKDYQLELTQSILEGLQVTEDIPASIAKLISDGLNGSEVKALSLEATSAILANVEMLSKQVNTFNAAMTQLPFEKLKNLSFDTAAGLIAAAGGFEQLDANLSSYYQSFYTAEEQRAQNITNTEAAFAALGKTMPTLDENTRSVYRSMVEAAAGMDLSVEANAKAYTGLLSLNDEMNLLAPAIDTVAQSAADAAANMTSAWANVMQARGAAGNDVTKFTAQAAIDAAFTEFKKTDKFGIASASQFQTITQADFANYSSDNQKLIATILTGFSDLSKANAPAVVEAAQVAQTTQADSYAAVDTSIADAIAQITKGLTDAGVSLGVELLKAQGKTVDAMAAQRDIDTAGYNEAQVALYDYNQTLRDQITALGEAAAAKQAFDGKLKSLQQQYDDLAMNQAQKRNAEWLSLNAQDTTGQLSGLQIAIWDFGDAAAKAAKDVSDAAEATRTAAAASKEQAANELSTAITRNSWRDKLDVLMGSRTQEQMDTQNALAGVTDLATVELILLVRGLEKTQAAAATAAAAAKELADQAEAAAQALASTNQGWKDQLDVLTGAQTDRSIALRDATDESTRALMRQVYAQQDLKTAAEEATQAAATLKAAFESLESARVSVANAYKSIADKAEATNTAVDAAKDAITQGYLSALDAQTAAQQNVADITRQAAVEMRGFADDIQDFILQMSTSDLGSSSKAQQLAASQTDFAVSAAQARAGDKNALAGITGKASNLLGAGKDQFANATDYARFTAKIGNTLQDLATLADGRAGPLAEAIDPMVKAQADLIKVNQDVEKWAEAASVSGASTAKTVADYLKDWTKATAEDALARADLKAAQLLTQEIDIRTLDVLGELKLLIESYNNAKSSVTDAGGILPSLTVGTVAIIPSVFNPIASGSGDTARLEALIDGLTQEVIGLRAEAQATAGHTSRTARLLDRAMPDGDALATRTAA